MPNQGERESGCGKRELEGGREREGGLGKSALPHTKALMWYSNDTIMEFNSVQHSILHADG